MKRPKTLTATFVQKIRTPGRYGDGRGGFGLSLLVKEMSNGRISKSWSQRLILNGKPCMLGLGAFPVVSLADARKLALENKQALLKGIDPRKSVPLFKDAAQAVIGIQSEGWKNAGKSMTQWQASLRDYAFPVIGNTRVDKINTADCLKVLLPHWSTKHETMRRVKSRIAAVMKWSIAKNFRQDDPTIALNSVLPKTNGTKKHHKSLPHDQVAGAIAKIKQSGAYWSTLACLEFIILTATRSGEARLATWDEIDCNSKMWVIPAKRMKAKKKHRVPLSDQAVEVLAHARQYSDGSDLIFPAASGKPMSDSTVSKLLRENNVGCVVHGFRSSFRNWAAENGFNRDVCEASLAHSTTKNQAEAAYYTSDLIQQRQELMQVWANYLTS